MALRAQPEPAPSRAGAAPSAPPAPAGAPARVDPGEVAAALASLDGLTGLAAAKTYVHELAAFVRVQEWRAAAGLARERVVMHMVFRGTKRL